MNVNHRKYFDKKDAFTLWFTQGKRENLCSLNSKNFPAFTKKAAAKLNKTKKVKIIA
jgi:hypothetical protein